MAVREFKASCCRHVLLAALAGGQGRRFRSGAAVGFLGLGAVGTLWTVDGRWLRGWRLRLLRWFSGDGARHRTTKDEGREEGGAPPSVRDID